MLYIISVEIRDSIMCMQISDAHLSFGSGKNNVRYDTCMKNLPLAHISVSFFTLNYGTGNRHS